MISLLLLVGGCFVMIGPGAILMLCDFSMCGDEVIANIPSPDGGQDAVLWSRDCGATTKVSYSISIVPAGIRSTHGLEEGRVLTVAHQPPLDWAWTSPTELVISSFSEEAFHYVKVFNGITVKLRGDAPNASQASDSH